MTVYIALLRGINVGGKNKIKMADLRGAMTGLGLGRVQTYIQSGNILFESPASSSSPSDGSKLRERIECEIERVFGLSIKVILRTAEELRGIAAGCPFSAEEVAAAEATCEGECLYVAMLAAPPPADRVAKLLPAELPALSPAEPAAQLPSTPSADQLEEQLSIKPSADRLEKQWGIDVRGDQFWLVGRDMYLLFRSSIRNSKLAAQVEKLGVPVTVRNWNTINKLVAMANDMAAAEHTAD